MIMAALHITNHKKLPLTRYQGFAADQIWAGNPYSNYRHEWSRLIVSTPFKRATITRESVALEIRLPSHILKI